MSGVKVTKTHSGAYRRPENPANFITYAIAACVTFVGLIFAFRLSIGFMGMVKFPILAVALIVALVVFVFGIAANFGRAGVSGKVMNCEKPILTFAATMPLLLVGLQDYNASNTDRVFGYVLFAVIACAVLIDIALNVFCKVDFKLFELALYVVIGFACVIRLHRIAVLCGDLCFWLGIGGFSAYLAGTVISSIPAIKCRGLINSIAVVIGTALNFVGIFFYVL